MISSICVFFLAFASSFALDLPAYIKPCSLSDANIKACLTESIVNSVPTIIKGDKTYKVPSLHPIKIPHIEISLGEGVNMVFSNANIYTFENPKIKDVTYDAAKQFLKVVFVNPVVKADTHYNMNMKLLGLPIRGEGPATLSFGDVEMALSAQMKTVKKNGVEHFAVESATATFIPTTGTMNFENLFNGDPRLGPVTNQLLNDNWKEFIGVLEPTINQIFSGLMKNTLGAYVGLVPKDKIFLP